MSGTDNNKKEDAWKPELFTKEVCCMVGMDCWEGQANSRGKVDLEN